MKRNLTCIICPKGCSLVAQIRDHEVSVSGNTCPKGEQYAIDECLHPMRTVTATVRVANRPHTMVSVKTQQPVPKERMMDVMAMLRRISINAPVSIGDIVLTDVFGTNIIVTKAID